jgi:hypothetical protein
MGLGKITKTKTPRRNPQTKRPAGHHTRRASQPTKTVKRSKTTGATVAPAETTGKRKRGRPPAGRPHNLARVNAETHARLERIAERLGITQAQAIEHAARVAAALLFPAPSEPKPAKTVKTRNL